jgi:hypothetical protein
MKHLKEFQTFEAYVGPIFPNSKFTQEDMDELHEMFQDFAITYNIKNMTVNTSHSIPSHILFAAYDDPDDGEINQYIIGQSRNDLLKVDVSFIDIKLFDNVDEIIETLRDNFIPQVKSLGWIIPNENLKNGALINGMTITEEENEMETPYTAVSITFAKKDV